MNYELAKSLKDAGFPQDGKDLRFDGFTTLDPHVNPNVPIHHEADSVLFPTLSELIEACGDNFEELVRVTQELLIEGEKITRWWRAYMTEDAFDKTGIPCVRDCDGYESGDTPEEAVARLWLALNKT